MKDYTSMNFDYYQVTIYGSEEEPQVVISDSKESAMEDAVKKYGKEMVKSVVRVTGDDFISEPDDVAQKQIAANRHCSQGKIAEERTLKTLASRYLTNRKNYKAASDEVKKGKNVLDTARKYKGVDAKELQAMGEDNNPIMEREDKLLYLARLGLMDKNEVLLLKRALTQKRSGTPMSVKNRDLLFKMMEKLVQMVTGHSHMWNLARRKVMEEVIDEFEDYAISEQWIQLDDYLIEAGYCDPPKTKAEIKKRYPNVETDVKNKNSNDLNPARFK